MLRRLHPDQPDSFAFTPANAAWAQAQIKKYPEGRQASAIIPLLWRAQEQEGWLTRPAIENVSEMLGLAHIRGLEVATFYFMFQLQPVGSVAHVQVCGTLSCMICGAEDLIAVCREKIAENPHELSADGKFSWEEVECLGACSNAPMAQIGKDFYEDLTVESFAAILDAFARGEVPAPGPQNGRFAAEPKSGLTTLIIPPGERLALNASAALAAEKGDAVARILGDAPAPAPETEAAAPAPEAETAAPAPEAETAAPAPEAEAAAPAPEAETAAPDIDVDLSAAAAAAAAAASRKAAARAAAAALGDAAHDDESGDGADPGKPRGLAAAREGGADDLKQIKGVGPKMEQLLNSMGFYHFDQIAAWTEAEIAWVDDNLEGFKGRVTRDEWVRQAQQLAAGEVTEFAARVARGDVPSSQ